MKNIIKLKATYLADMTLETKNISDYIKKHFNNNNYIIEQDKDLGWYNFKIGSKRYDSLIPIINDKYKVYLKEGYWYLDLLVD